MADVKWSTLFPKTGGSGRGGAFTGKVLTPAMSPYTVVAGDRLVVTQTDQPLVIDPGTLKDDEAFQVIDASRTFDKNPVTIKGDKLTIQIVGAGNDLILDMIGAGNLWEFIANGGQLLVADSPGYTGELPAGGGAPATGGGAADLTDVPIFEFGQGDPLDSQHPQGGGNRDLVYISMGVEGNPLAEVGMWRWPANTPADSAGGKQWEKILFASDDEFDLQIGVRPIWLRGDDDPTSVDDTGGLSGKDQVSDIYYISSSTGGIFVWPKHRPREDETTVPNLWTQIKIGGAPAQADGPNFVFASDANYTAKEGDVVRVMNGVAVNIPSPVGAKKPILVANIHSAPGQDQQEAVTRINVLTVDDFVGHVVGYFRGKSYINHEIDNDNDILSNGLGRLYPGEAIRFDPLDGDYWLVSGVTFRS